jgi:hypothetical protein
MSLCSVKALSVTDRRGGCVVPDKFCAAGIFACGNFGQTYIIKVV